MYRLHSSHSGNFDAADSQIDTYDPHYGPHVSLSISDAFLQRETYKLWCCAYSAEDSCRTQLRGYKGNVQLLPR